MAITIGCCQQFKSASAYKEKCGFDGFEDASNKYLSQEITESIGPDCSAGCSATLTIDRKTCDQTGSPCGDTFVCCGPATDIISDTEKTVSKQYTEECFCCEGFEDFFDIDTYTLSDEYTKEMLEDDVAELLGGTDWGAIAWGEGVDLSFLEGGTVTQTAGSPSQVAAYYTDDADNPTWIQKIALKYKPATSKFCKLFYPQEGGPCTRTIVDATIGEEVDIDPPEDPGYIEIHPCCATDVCS